MTKKIRKKRARACVCEKKVVSLHAILGEQMKLLIVIGLIGAAMLLLSVGVLFRKDHTFRSQHIGDNARMREDGIQCATSQDREAQRKCSGTKKESKP